MKYSACEWRNTFCHSPAKFSLRKLCHDSPYIIIRLLISFFWGHSQCAIFLVNWPDPFGYSPRNRLVDEGSDKEDCIPKTPLPLIMFFNSACIRLIAQPSNLGTTLWFDDSLSSLLNRCLGWPVRSWFLRGHVLALWWGKATQMKYCRQTLTESTSGG